jgi:uncharacterized protein YigE (DUF2233 family)
VRTCLAISLILLASCDASTTAGAGEQANELGQSPCAIRYFENARFTVCPAAGSQIEIVTADPSGIPYRSFTRLEADLGERAGDVAFAMNAGMFDEEGHAIGLLIEDGKQLKAINRRDGSGNFHMKPNGAFLVRRDGTAEVVTTDEFEPGEDIAFATQSGPMLVIDGQIHPSFEPDGQSRHIRNGVGIGAGGPVFAMSEEPVSFDRFARLFRDELKASNALYFDGAVSSLWDPGNARRDIGAPLGPMVVVFKPD